MRLIDSESLYQRFIDYKLKHPTRYMDIDEIRIVISDEPTVDVLDKIRAEIEQIMAESGKAIRPFDGMEVVTYTKGFQDGIGSAIDLIDKYR